MINQKRNILKLFSSIEIVKRYTKKVFGMEFVPTNIDSDGNVQLLVIENEEIVGQFTTTFDWIIENDNKIGVIYVENKQKAFLTIKIDDIPYDPEKITIRTIFNMCK